MELTEYIQSLGKVGMFRLVGIISRVLGLFLLIFTIVLCALAVFAFGSVAAIDAMSVCMPTWAAALILGSVYIVLIVIAILCRKPLFVHPFIKLLTKQVKTEEELELKSLEAEHQAELHRVRMVCQAESAIRIWEWIKRLLRKIK